MRDDRLREGPVVTCIVLTVFTQGCLRRVLCAAPFSRLKNVR